jgi:DNA topoisomerase-3
VLWREYRGQPLGDDQLRELLQRRVLLRPLKFGEAGAVVLQLADSGALVEIPVPTGSRRPTTRRDRRGPARAAGGSTTRRRQRPAGETRGGRRPEGRTAAEIGGGLGPCPLCAAEVVEQEKSYSCAGWKSGCKFVIWKMIAGKRISVPTARALLRRGRSAVLQGFVAKSGRRFAARLQLNQGEIRFAFESGEYPRGHPDGRR